MMKPETRNVLLKAYAQLHKITEEFYSASDKAVENNDQAKEASKRAQVLIQELKRQEV